MSVKDVEVLVDRLQELRDKKKAVDDMYDGQIEVVTKQLEEKMKEVEVTKVTGARATASVSESYSVKVTDWEAVYQYIEENDAIDLLQRRISQSEVIARRDAEQPVPGVMIKPESKLTIRKRSQKDDSENS